MSKKGNTFVLKSDGNLAEFKITHDTNIPEGDIAEGHHATVYFRKSGADNLAQRVVVPDAAAK